MRRCSCSFTHFQPAIARASFREGPIISELIFEVNMVIHSNDQSPGPGACMGGGEGVALASPFGGEKIVLISNVKNMLICTPETGA